MGVAEASWNRMKVKAVVLTAWPWLVQVMDGLRRGQAVDADMATPGMATQHLMGDYTTAHTAARTPVRTPAAGRDRVAAEAAAQAHARRLQTPLLGEASTGPEGPGLDVLGEGEEGGVGASVAATPNPLAAAGSTPARGSGAAGGATPAATPGRGGGGGATPAATPLRDALGINTPGGATPLAGRRAERARLAGIKDGVRVGLGALPQPHNDYQLAGGAADVDGSSAPVDEEMTEEDAAEAAARRHRAAEDAKAHARALRSAVLRRDLPRPAAAAPPAAPTTGGGGGGGGSGVYAAADALISAEVARLVAHDNKRYSIAGKSAKKRKKKLEALAEAGPSALEVECSAEELAEAEGLLEAEAEYLKEKYGHASTARLTVVELMAAASAEVTCAFV